MKKCLSLLLAVLLMLGISTAVVAEEEIVDLYIQMTVTMEDGVIYADLVDDQGGTVSTWPVSLEIDGEQVDTVHTDEYGTASFHYAIPEDTQQIACVAQDGQYDQYHFIGCKVYLNYVPSTEPEEESDPTDTEEQTTHAPETTTLVVVATTTTTEKKLANTTPMTTMLKGDRVAIGVNADNALLIASQCTQSEFDSRARMWMENTLYRSLVPSSSSALQLQMTLNAQAGDQAHLITAKNADPTYASFTDEEVKGFAVDMTIAYVDENTTVPLEIEDGVYTIEMPVPTVLRSCKKIAVAVCTSDGLAQLTEVNPANGVLSFTIQRFQTLAIVGFGSSAVSLETLSSTPWLLVLAIVLGLVLIAGGVVLLVLVVFRRKKGAPTFRTTTDEDGVKRVSLDAEDEDDVFVAPREKGKETVISQVAEVEQPKTVVETVPPVQEKPAMPTVPAPSPKAPAKVDTTNDIDDLLDEVLSDLDSLDT